MNIPLVPYRSPKIYSQNNVFHIAHTQNLKGPHRRQTILLRNYHSKPFFSLMDFFPFAFHVIKNLYIPTTDDNLVVYHISIWIAI